MHALRQELRRSLEEASDLHRLGARAAAGRASPRDLAAVARTLRLLPAVRANLAGRKAHLLRELERLLDACPELSRVLEAALEANPPADPRDGGVIRDGYDARLDRLREAARAGKEWMARYQAQEATATGIPGLKVGYNEAFGYFLEATHAQAQKVPGHYQRRQTLKHAERYVTPELRERGEQVLAAEAGGAVARGGTVRGAARRRPRRPPGCNGPATCWRGWTCWRLWPNWPRRGATAGRS